MFRHHSLSSADCHKKRTDPCRRTPDCTGFRKVGIEEPGADCLRWSGVEEFRMDIVKGVRRTRLSKKIRSTLGKQFFQRCSLSFLKGASHTLTISVFYLCSPTTEFRDRFFCSYLPWKACAIRQVFRAWELCFL